MKAYVVLAGVHTKYPLDPVVLVTTEEKVAEKLSEQFKEEYDWVKVVEKVLVGGEKIG